MAEEGGNIRGLGEIWGVVHRFGGSARVITYHDTLRVSRRTLSYSCAEGTRQAKHVPVSIFDAVFSMV